MEAEPKAIGSCPRRYNTPLQSPVTYPWLSDNSPPGRRPTCFKWKRAWSIAYRLRTWAAAPSVDCFVRATGAMFSLNSMTPVLPMRRCRPGLLNSPRGQAKDRGAPPPQGAVTLGTYHGWCCPAYIPCQVRSSHETRES